MTAVQVGMSACLDAHRLVRWVDRFLFSTCRMLAAVVVVVLTVNKPLS